MAKKSNRGIFGALGTDAVAPSEAATPARARAGSYLTGRENRLAQVARGEVKDKTLLLVEPERCRMWAYHNRRYDLLNEQRCADLIDGLKAQGRQEFPAVVRRLDSDDSHDFEVICGARRHWSIQWLRDHNYRDFRFLVEVRDLDDEEAFRLSDVENRDRADISDYERARDYARALERYYSTQKEMAARLEVSQAWLSEYLDLAALPEPVVDAFGAITDIRVQHSRNLKPLLKDRNARAQVLERAQKLAAEQSKRCAAGEALLDGAGVVRELSQRRAAGRSGSRGGGTETYKAASGKKMLEVNRKGRALVLTAHLQSGATRAEMLEAFEKAIAPHLPK